MDASSSEVLLMADESLRILVVLPMYGGSLPIGRYCAAALTELGHSVRVFQAPELYQAFTGIRRLDLLPRNDSSLRESFLRVVNQAIWLMAQEQRPQLVLALAQAPLDQTILGRMRKMGIRTIMWFVENYRFLTYWKYMAPSYDAFAVIQKEPFLSELAKIGQKHAFYLPLAALPDFHRKIQLADEERKEYGSAISFLGAGYPNRRLAFRPLAERDFKIWGSDWDDEKALAKNIQRNGQRISEEESVKIYNASDINLNLHSSISAEKLVSMEDFVNPRTFELASMGAFQLVDRRELLPELFNDDELATFDTLDGFYKAVDHFLAAPAEREAYAKRARERVLKEHTYQQRMQTLIEYMRENFGPWRIEKDENAEIFDSLEPAIQKEIKALAARLGLAPTASFSDIVARLRQQNGELSPMETAILFLDEWRKQYS